MAQPVTHQACRRGVCAGRPRSSRRTIRSTHPAPARGAAARRRGAFQQGDREPRKAGLQFTARRVTTQPEFERALREFRPDLIIADHNLPQFNGAAALALARQMALAAPFILLTGSLDEESAVEYMKAGATDYILKDRLAPPGAAGRARPHRQPAEHAPGRRRGAL